MLLDQDFYLSDDVVNVSKLLLGKNLFTSFSGIKTGGRIVETEAYRAPDDKACHAYNNRLTDRTKTMFEEGGTLYVYISYGLHKMINVVTSTKGKAHAILIRAIEPITGVETMLERRNHEKLSYSTLNGPGKIGQALGVDKVHDGSKLFTDKNGIWIENSNLEIKDSDIYAGPRVGMSIHTGKDAHRPWRFYLKGNKWVSKPKIVKYPDIPRT